ncbi:type II and III secretion system protein [Nioella nitratireducens]|uniref:type II and III secretion system protein n=1 Tax=Nioella nitratireducens TaxID=1287720 RepID=UPI0011BA76E5|nr:type II and III secretion system protein [Nioella nitratireducens]
MDRRLFMSGLAGSGLVTGLVPTPAISRYAFIEDEDDTEFDVLRRLRLPWVHRLAEGLPQLLGGAPRILRLIELANVNGVARQVQRAARISVLSQPMVTMDANSAAAPRANGPGMEFLSNVRLSGDPALVTRVAETDVRSPTSIVVGGIIYQVPNRNNHQQLSVPVLGDLPVVGHLFRRSRPSEQSNLILFVTARVIQQEE